MHFLDRGDAGKFLAFAVGSLLLALLIASGRARFGFPTGSPVLLGELALIALLPGRLGLVVEQEVSTAGDRRPSTGLPGAPHGPR